MTKRAHKPRVTKADMARAVEFLQMMGAKIATLETTPGKIKVITTDGAGLTLGDEEESLDRELREHLSSRYGHG